MESINEIWPCIQIIFEQKELRENANDAITKIKEEIGDKPTTANNIIKFLNSKNKYDLEELGVGDKTETILEVKKFLTKRNLIVQLEEKSDSLEIAINRFFSRLEPLTQKVLPCLFVINDKLMNKKDYANKLQDISRDTTMFSNIKGTMIA